jgi:hypothetical protein
METTVVGWVNGHHLHINTLREWVDKSWSSKEDQFPLIQSFLNVWFIFFFQSLTDITRVLKSPWCIDLSPILLKRLTPFFNESYERVDELPIWVRLPGLPMEIWTLKGFECLGNDLDRYMYVDISFTSTGKISVDRVLVSLNIRKGLTEEIELSWGDRYFLQKLDYEGIPFKCCRCHKHGHNACDFTLTMRNKVRDYMGSV